ncbi:MAG: hypothetical protein SPJ13_03145 [Bacteroidales bacterium]|nr:hypothetical protein [Bacteroidales bacterium]
MAALWQHARAGSVLPWCCRGAGIVLAFPCSGTSRPLANVPLG